MTLHFVPNYRMLANWNEQKGAWAQSAIDRVDASHHNATPIIGGDFNNGPCLGNNAQVLGTPGCEITPMWRAFTIDHDYAYALDHNVDHIFTEGTIIASGTDDTYKPLFNGAANFLACRQLYLYGNDDQTEGVCKTDYYSDHSYTWALIGA